MNTVKKISADEIKGGMIILRFDRNGVPYNYFSKNLPASMVTGVKNTLKENNVKFAFIRVTDENSASGGASQHNDANDKVRSLLSRLNNPEDEVSTVDMIAAQKQQNRVRNITKDILSQVRLGNAVNTDNAKNVVSDLVENCMKKPNTFVNMSRLKNFDHYSFIHSVNVSVIAIAIGRKLGLPYDELNKLGLAGMLHDIGKMKVPESILNKPGKLTDEEFFIIKMHPIYGYDLLRNDPSIPPEVLLAVRHHHEKSDGTGYPDGLKEHEISKYAKIISIADVYDAITSERTYHKGMNSEEAFKLLFSWSGSHFNDVLVNFFINLIGTYPAGMPVILNTGEISVVLNSKTKTGLQPEVLIVTDSNGNMLPSPVLFDLSIQDTDDQRNYKTIERLAVKDINIDGNEIINRYFDAKAKEKKKISERT